MGTNYYLEKVTSSECPHCGHEKEGDQLHIGKSSGGWTFSLRIHPDLGIYDLDDWMPLFGRYPIVDGYGKKVSIFLMLEIITNRAWPKDVRDFDYERNYAEPGPNGLVRSKIGHGCVKHGAGTWDCIDRDFS